MSTYAYQDASDIPIEDVSSPGLDLPPNGYQAEAAVSKPAGLPLRQPSNAYRLTPAPIDDPQLHTTASTTLVIPQYLTHEEDDRCIRCCDCERFVTHCFFLFACLWFMLASSLPRIVALCDIITHIIAYLIEVRQYNNSVGEGIRHDFQHYNFSHSALDLIFLSLLRSIVLYWVYAYKRQLNRQIVFFAFLAMIGSSLYCIVKVAVVTRSGPRGVGIYSLIYTIAEWLIYTIMRRRRILVDKKAADLREASHDGDVENGLFVTSQQRLDGGVLPVSTVIVPPQQQKQQQQQQTKNLDGLQDDVYEQNIDISQYTAAADVALKKQQQAESESLQSEFLSNPPHQQQQQQQQQQRRFAGARRHKSTQNSRIGAVGGISTQDRATYNDSSEVHSNLIGSQVFPTANTPSMMYAPTPHRSIVYPAPISPQIAKLREHNSQFLLFEGVRIHYKFLVNPRYKDYFDAQLNQKQTPQAGEEQSSQISPPTSMDTSKIPPCLVIIPGFISNVYNFDQLESALKESSAIFVFDRPGFGLSEMLTEEQIEIKKRDDFQQHRRHRDAIAAEIQRINQRIHQSQQQSQSSAQQVNKIDDSSFNNDEILTNVYDYYTLLQNQCSDFHPYRPNFIARLISTVLHVYRLHSLGCIVAGHQSGGTLALSLAIEFQKVCSFINRNLRSINSSPQTYIEFKSPIVGLILLASSIFEDGLPPLIKQVFSTSLGHRMVKSLLASECSEVALKRAFYKEECIPKGLLQLHQLLFTCVPQKDEAMYCMALTECEQNGLSERYVEQLKLSLPHIICPVLVIHGEEDRFVPFSSSTKIVRALSQSVSIQVVRITHCGHLSFEENPLTVASSIDSFVLAVMRRRSYEAQQPQ